MAEMKAGRRVGAALKGKVILVVSVAEDLGYELATPLAKCGCRIVLAGRASSQLQKTSSEIKALGLGVEVSVCQFLSFFLLIRTDVEFRDYHGPVEGLRVFSFRV